MFTFKSMENEKAMYRFSNTMNEYDGFYKNPSRFVHSKIGMFDTYGDGEVQHSPAYGVSIDNIRDCLGSLAIHLSEHPEDVADVERYWPNSIDKDKVKFLLRLKYNSDKETFYNLSECKKSYKSSKRYDKRWEVIPSWYKPNAQTIFRLLCEGYWSGVEGLVYLRQINAILCEELNSWYNVDFESTLNIKFDTVTRQSLDAISFFVKGLQETRSAKSIVDCIKNNWKERRN